MNESKRNVLVVATVVLFAFGFLWYVGVAKGQGVVQLGQLTKISPRESANLSEITFIRMPCYHDPVPGCPECQLRYGATVTFKSGLSVDFTEEAEKELRKITGFSNVEKCPVQ